MLVARDGADDLLDAHEGWVREVVRRGLAEEASLHFISSDMLRFNRPALATLALLHLWLRRQAKADRNALISIAARSDGCAPPAFTAALDRIVKTDPRLLKAAMRAAFESCRWGWHRKGEDEADQRRFEGERATATKIAISAEIAWLDGGDEPAWPVFPDERPILPRSMRIRATGPGDSEVEAERPGAVRAGIATVHVDSQTAARWLRLLNSSYTGALGFGGEIVEAYSAWTAAVNGLGLPAFAESSGLRTTGTRSSTSCSPRP